VLIWYGFPVLVCLDQKNLATLAWRATANAGHDNITTKQTESVIKYEKLLVWRKKRTPQPLLQFFSSSATVLFFYARQCDQKFSKIAQC
jgi:hypothetical protein